MTLILSGTDGVSDIDGSAATPAIRGTDTNTGIFFPAADTIAFSEGGAEVARFDSSGNFGIGTSSPAAKFQTNSTDGTIAIFRTTSGANNGRLNIDISDSAATAGFALGGNSSFPAMTFANGGAERMRIDSSGYVLVGCTALPSSSVAGASLSPSVTSVNPHFFSAGSATGSVAQISFINGNGTVGQISTSGSGTTYATSSDYRLKENVVPMQNALGVVTQLKPVIYNWKVDGSSGQGFIAHELQEVVPDCVTGVKDAVQTYTDEEGNEATRPVYQGIDTSFLVATLTAAIQEQQAIITALTARITALEAK